MIIRKAGDGDVDDIAELEKVCFTVPWSRESVEYDVTENPLAVYVVAEMNGRVAGYIGYWSIAGECNINNVAVSPEYRRLHVGTALMAAVFDICGNEGIDSYTLEVRKSNIPAIGLYKKCGFRESGIRKGYYEDNGEDAIIMWKK